MMNEQLISRLTSLPFFDGKNVQFNTNNHAVQFSVNNDILLMGWNAGTLPHMGFFCSVKNDAIKIEFFENTITLVQPVPRRRDSFTFNTYDLETHNSTGIDVEYEVVEAMREMHNIFRESLGDKDCYAKCTKCSEELTEEQVYGEWDDWCQECWHEEGKYEEGHEI